MVKQQDITNKVNEDFVKFKARLMHLGKEQIFQQSDKITLAKKIRRSLSHLEADNKIYHLLLDMQNVYDVFYDYYKEMQGDDILEEVEVADLITEVFNRYKY